ncbi:DHH family phosphoesterase [Blattabacterium cuenoti]|uniref:DHH family phosphoesterase n=1 Tax=Blattabacterium cuenoti TaxID=1653831 RepID=UPI00163C608D|nr:bifunctional oligoribonuclease/PAP phosphatase NrnA [Blattabacterium cuenoti]
MINLHEISKKKIILLPHNNPDGDALGSSLALFFYFKKLRNKVSIISPTTYSKSFQWIPGVKEIIIFSETKKNSIQKKINESDYIFLIDCNNVSRIGELKESFFSSKAKKGLIDHHPFPMNCDFMFYDTTVPSTSMMVFRFISYMNNLEKLDKDIATCLYIGLMTDTGYFRYPSVTSESHFIAGKLIEKGINIPLIYNHLQEKYNENKLRLLSIALKRIKIIPNHRTAYTFINALDLQRYPYKKGDTDGITNYGLGIKNIVFSAFFFEERETFPIKISFRSKGDFDVNLFSRKYFGGGGHKNAAGGILNKSLYESIEYFLSIINNYK